MSEMVERVAEAIVAEMVRQCGTPPPKDPTLSEGAIKVARAAIEAMREPSNRMKGAGDRMRTHLDDEPHPFEINDSVAIWRAMIDAAIEPTDCVQETGKA
jgi:hypothetical protein